MQEGAPDAMFHLRSKLASKFKLHSQLLIHFYSVHNIPICYVHIYCLNWVSYQKGCRCCQVLAHGEMCGLDLLDI